MSHCAWSPTPQPVTREHRKSKFGYSGNFIKPNKKIAINFQRILCTYLRTNQTANWAKALPIVQAMKNRRFHRGIQRSPFEAMFGKKMMLGSENGQIPTDEERGIDKEIEDEVFLIENKIIFKKSLG